MKREIVITNDGSSSIYLPEIDESYHSKHGAINEANHVFIVNGLDLIQKEAISVLEIGFGTGLNTFITFLEGKKRGVIINYVGVEAYPVNEKELNALNYSQLLGNLDSDVKVFNKIHSCAWGVDCSISDNFILNKQKMLFQEIDFENRFDVIYFDAFGYRVQPELWSEDVFRRMYRALKKNGILTTYAARSPIKRAMIASGFVVKKLAGPPGKREMMQGVKS
jgi:tRNA U34 5-methylaminomethyl-2-thiouridine-forming methyltransferase MnmC